MRMRLLLLGGGNALGQALVRQGAEEDIGFLAPRPPEGGWDVASLTQLLDDHRPDALVNLAYYFDWFQAESVSEQRLAQQERAVERLAELCQHHQITLVQPSSYRVFDGSRATAYSEKDEPVPLGLRGQALWRIEQSVRRFDVEFVGRIPRLEFGETGQDVQGGRVHGRIDKDFGDRVPVDGQCHRLPHRFVGQERML